MPRIIEYRHALTTLEGEGLKCVYPNGGAFAFADRVREQFIGWVTEDDASLRPEARERARRVQPPTTQRLAALMGAFWRDESVGGATWLMPKSHWAHELHHGSAEWMRELLRSISVDADALELRADASAIEFELAECASLARVIPTLMERLQGSDFMLVFRSAPVLCTVHHHRQLWWQTTEARLMGTLESVVPA